MPLSHCRCGNVAAIFELDENLKKGFTIFEAAPNVSPSVPHTLMWPCLLSDAVVLHMKSKMDGHHINFVRINYSDSATLT